MKRLIIDSSSLIYAAFYTQGHLSYDGQETGVIYGFLNKVLKLATKFKTNKFYFCFDHPINFREQQYPDYKGNRKNRNLQTRDEIKRHKSRIKQVEELRKIVLRKMGFRNIFWQEGFESDDLMAVLSKKLKNSFIVTSDNDMFQCLNDCSIILPSKLKVFTKEDFEAIYKVDPSQWPVCKSIGGCSGDNVTGIKGASDPKNPSSFALKYVRKELTSGAVFDRITSKEGKQTIKKNMQVVKLPLDGKIDIITKKNDFTKRGLIRVFSNYGFKSFLEKEQFKKWEDIFIKE